MFTLIQLLQSSADLPTKLTAILIVLIGIIAMVYLALYENLKLENRRLVSFITKQGANNLIKDKEEKDSKNNE